jgi:hypothetical protein
MLHVQAARLESLSDRRVVEAPELTVAYDELCAVVANGSRGEMERRLRTRMTRVEIDLGPYHIEGAVHGTPASDPVIAAFRRANWVPLTDVTVTYTAGDDSQSDTVTTLIVNRDLATLFRAIEEKSVLLPWETSRAAAVQAAVKAQAEVDVDGFEEDGRKRPEPVVVAQEPLV